MSAKEKVAQMRVVASSLVTIQELEKERACKSGLFDLGVCAGLKSAARIIMKNMLKELNNE